MLQFDRLEFYIVSDFPLTEMRPFSARHPCYKSAEFGESEPIVQVNEVFRSPEEMKDFTAYS